MISSSDNVGLRIEARPDGTIEAVYLRLRDLPVSKTKEVVRGVLLADYSRSGILVGVEILGRVSASKISRLIKDAQRRTTVLRFLRNAAPPELVTSSL